MRDPVTTPDGRTWQVRRRWVPRLGSETLWGRFRRNLSGIYKRIDPGESVGCLGAIGDSIAAAAIVLVVVFLVLPFLAAAVDVLVVLLVALLGVAARILLRRPWVLEAAADDGTVLRWRVVGWRVSSMRRDEIESTLRAGVVPPDDAELAKDRDPPS